MDNHPNWFQTDGLNNFQNHLKVLDGTPLRLLQIGAYTGDASVWMVDNIMSNPDSVLIDVDTWEGSEEPVHYQMNWHTVESVYDAKTHAARLNRKIIKYKSTSDEFFKNNRETYSFIYIDGDHTAYGVIKDAVSAYECLSIGGIIAFDDYQWSAGLGAIKEPRLAIDSFASIYADRLEEVLSGYQRWFRKIR
jgi:predicted O-methyltransferase YrrM